MGYVSLPEELLYLWMTISDDAIKVNAARLLARLFFHVTATTNLIALLSQKKEYIYRKGIIDFAFKIITNNLCKINFDNSPEPTECPQRC